MCSTLLYIGYLNCTELIAHDSSFEPCIMKLNMHAHSDLFKYSHLQIASCGYRTVPRTGQQIQETQRPSMVAPKEGENIGRHWQTAVS